MQNVKIIEKNYNPSKTEINEYKQYLGVKCRRPIDLRFGKIVTMTDEDLDG